MRAGERPAGWDWRAFGFVILSAIAFAVLLKPIGLVLTLVVTVLLASAGGRLLRPLPALLLAAALVVVNVGIFVLALGMPIALWPRWSSTCRELCRQPRMGFGVALTWKNLGLCLFGAWSAP